MSRHFIVRLTLLTALALLSAAGVAPASASASPDLAVSISVTPERAVAGDALTVRLTARNNGTSPATGSYLGLVVLGRAGLSDGPECINILGRLAVCDVGTLNPGETVRRSFHFKQLEPGELQFQASVSSDTADGGPDDNTANTKVIIGTPADLKLGLQIGDAGRGGRSNATLVATVRNTTDQEVHDTQLQVEVERGLSIVGLPSGCSRDRLRVTCELGTMSSSSTATRLVGLRAPPKSTYSLVGGVTSSSRDATPEDNLAQALLTTLANTRVVALSRLVRGLPGPGGCVRNRTLRLRLRTPSGFKLSKAYFYVRGKRVRKVSGRALRRPVTLRKLPRAMYTLRVHSTLRGGQRRIGHARLIDCKARVL